MQQKGGPEGVDPETAAFITLRKGESKAKRSRSQGSSRTWDSGPWERRGETGEPKKETALTYFTILLFLLQ